jgi:hypothetical protein
VVVEVAGIEPASSSVPTSLLRAQLALGCRAAAQRQRCTTAVVS